MYDVPTARMSSLSIQADKLQAQISTGKRITTASDDAVGWRQLDTIARADADDKAYATNVKLAQGLLAQTDTALSSVTSQLQRAQELAVEAGSGTLSAENRQAIGAELGVIMDDLMSLANSKDVRGQSLFGGATEGAAFTKNSDGSISYAGTGTAASIPIGSDSSVTATVSGDQAFGDMFAQLKALTDSVNAGNPPDAATVAGLQSAADQVSATRSSIGARAVRVDLESDRLVDAAADRTDAKVGIENVDVSGSITELQKTLTILQATQASFTKLTSMSLFDYLK
jgi:flagellar hook-associated protein 3 FlgL